MAPVELGGSGMGYSAHCVVMEELSKGSGSIGLSYSAHSALNMAQILRHGTDLQKQKYIPDLCSGKKVGALSMSEPNSGSDVVSMKTNALLQSDGTYLLNGTKMWCTNGPEAYYIFSYFHIYFYILPNSSITTIQIIRLSPYIKQY